MAAFFVDRHDCSKRLFARYQLCSNYWVKAKMLSTVYRLPPYKQEPIPYYVENEIHGYLKCGILAYGFARARCPDCGHDFIIAFSCKKRGVCPSCCTKYIELTTAHIIDNILPKLAIRQFVLSMPKWIRYFVARNSELSCKVLRIFIDAIEQQ